MEMNKIQLKTTDNVEARSLGLPHGVVCHFAIKEGSLVECTGVSSKDGQPFRFLRMEYTCVAVESLDPNVPTPAVRGQITRMSVSTGKGEEDTAIFAYNKGLLQNAGISVSDWGDTEVIFAEIVGKEFDGKVVADKNGYTSIQTHSLRMLNRK